MKNNGPAAMEDVLREWDFPLSEDRIAVVPPPRREDARLLIVRKDSGQLEDSTISALGTFLREGDLLVFNETRVRQCRTFLQRKSGRRLEALFLSEGPDGWTALVRGSGRVKEGEILLSADPSVFFRFFRRDAEALLVPVTENGARIWIPGANTETSADAELFFSRFGRVPLPPYIRRSDNDDDKVRYQTVFASRTGSAAAPTAGLHFTPELLSGLKAAGVGTAFLELEIGYGTFAPLTEEHWQAGRLHPERFTIPSECADAIRARKGRLIAVGTTTLRALESSRRDNGEIRAGTAATTLFLRPPDRVQSVDGLLTNFHLPRSSLLLLVASFAGSALMHRAYKHALDSDYRFFSYGDAMLIL